MSSPGDKDKDPGKKASGNSNHGLNPNASRDNDRVNRTQADGAAAAGSNSNDRDEGPICLDLSDVEDTYPCRDDSTSTHTAPVAKRAAGSNSRKNESDEDYNANDYKRKRKKKNAHDTTGPSFAQGKTTGLEPIQENETLKRKENKPIKSDASTQDEETASKKQKVANSNKEGEGSAECPINLCSSDDDDDDDDEMEVESDNEAQKPESNPDESNEQKEKSDNGTLSSSKGSEEDGQGKIDSESENPDESACKDNNEESQSNTNGGRDPIARNPAKKRSNALRIARKSAAVRSDAFETVPVREAKAIVNESKDSESNALPSGGDGDDSGDDDDSNSGSDSDSENEIDKEVPDLENFERVRALHDDELKLIQMIQILIEAFCSDDATPSDELDGSDHTHTAPDIAQVSDQENEGASRRAVDDERAPAVSDSSNTSDLEYENALQVLVKAESETHDSNRILNADEAYPTDLYYHIIQQFCLFQITQSLEEEYEVYQDVGDGCLKCRYCSAFTQAHTEQSFIRKFPSLQTHLLCECNKIPKHLRDALKVLRKIDEERTQIRQSSILVAMMQVYQRMVAFGNGKSRNMVEAQEQPVAAPTPPESTFSRNEKDLELMTIIETEKILCANHYPTLFFTAWNKERDYLYDFKAFVAPSRIPNSGNGAFLKLVRVRSRSEYALSEEDEPGNASLIMRENGKDKQVFVRPLSVHNPDDCSPMDDGNYEEDNTIQFSAWDIGCGSIDIGCYGPFFETDIKAEEPYIVKNFLFDFEPACWSYGVTLDNKNEEMEKILDITSDETGETHLRARENIPMHVNEIGHDPHLCHNVTPLERDSGNIHYYVHPRCPMSVSDEPMELLVDYGSIYEQVRVRKGYGLSKDGGDAEDESQRIKRNQSERVQVEQLIFSLSITELYDILIPLQGIFQSIICATNASIREKNVTTEMSRRWTARFRMHWLEGLLRRRCDFLLARNFRDEFVCNQIFIILDMMKLPSEISQSLKEYRIAYRAFTNEIFEENVFAASQKYSLLHPLDPSLWCSMVRKLVYQVAQELSLKYRTGGISIHDVIQRVYQICTDTKQKVTGACTNRIEVEELGFEPSENRIINAHLKTEFSDERCENCLQLLHTPEESAAVEAGPILSGVKIRYLKILKDQPKSVIYKIDEHWYLVWIVRVLHTLTTRCFPAKDGGYSLQTLCDRLGVKTSDAEKCLNTKMVCPTGSDDYVSTYDEDLSKRPKREKRSRVVCKWKKEHTIPDTRQIIFTNPAIHPNVDRNRGSDTFWCEYPAGDHFPEGWIIHIHKRKVGKKHLDYYWYPKCGTPKIRSMPGVRRYLEKMGDKEAIKKLFQGNFS